MAIIAKSLLGIHEELDRAVKDLAFFGSRYQAIHPAAGGDVSQVFSEKTSQLLIKRFRRNATRWFKMESIQELAEIRKDGRTGYRSEGIADPKFYKLTKLLDGRVMLITCTGSQLPQVIETLHSGEDGRLLNLVEVGKDGRVVRILYGNREFGIIPSIELHVHMLTCSIGIKEGLETVALVHAHPYHLNLLGMHPKIQGDFKAFNAVIYTQVEGLNRNAPDLIGIVPYLPSGSAALVSASIDPLLRHPMILWMNHGFIAKSFRIDRAYALIAYAEQAAEAALDVLQYGGVGLPLKRVKSILRSPELLSAYHRLKLKGSSGTP